MTSTPTSPEASGPDADGLFARARAGDEEAWRALFEECYPKVIRVVRRKLNSKMMRTLYDSTDFASDVWKSLAAKSGRFDFPTVDSLMSFLAQAARQKVDDEYRRLLADKRQEGRKQAMDGEDGTTIDPPGSGPSPSQEAVAREALHLLMDGLPEAERAVVARKVAGASNDEAAEVVGWHPRKLQRFLKDLHDSKWLRRQGG